MSNNAKEWCSEASGSTLTMGNFYEPTSKRLTKIYIEQLRIKNFLLMKKIIIFFIAYPWRAHNQVDLVLAATAKHDTETKKIGIYCDGGCEEIQNSCEIVINSRNKNKENICKACNAENRIFFKGAFDVEMNISVKQREKTTPKEKLSSKIRMLNEMEKRLILSPDLSRTRTSSTDELREAIGDKHFVDLLKKRAESAEKTKALFKKLIAERIKPDNIEDIVLITFNGRFHPYQGIVMACTSLRIEYILHERGTEKNTWRISKNVLPYDAERLCKYIEKNIGELANISGGRKSLQDFLQRRRNKGQQNFLDFAGENELRKDTQELVERHRELKLVVLFTSGLDEICIFNKNYTFKAQLELIEKCAKECKRIGWKLVVRQHPNLGSIGSPTNAQKFLQNCKELASIEDFTIIDEDEKVHWEYLAKRAIVSIIPYSSLILDMIYQGYPVVNGPYPQFTGLIRQNIDWNFENESIKDIAKKAQHLLFSEEQKERAEIYADIYYIRSCKILTPAKITNLFDSEILNLSMEELIEESKGNMEFVRDYVLRPNTDYPIQFDKK